MKNLFISSLIFLGLAVAYTAYSFSIVPNSATDYAILASTFSDTSGGTTINGSVGYTTPPATLPTISGVTHIADGYYNTAGTEQASILSNLNSQPCDFNFGSATDLSLLTQPLTAGVYCVIGAQSVGSGGLTLTSGQYVFRSTGALNTVANSQVIGGDACNVYWTPVATTLGANSSFKGMVIDDAGITVGANTNWTGNALAFGGTVTTDTDTISVPSCTETSTTTDTTATSTPPEATSTPVVIPTPVQSHRSSGSCAYGYNFSLNRCNYPPQFVPIEMPTTTPVQYWPNVKNSKG